MNQWQYEKELGLWGVVQPWPAAAATSRVQRLASFLGEMFPPWTHLSAAAAHFAAVCFALQILAGADQLALTWNAVLGALTVVFFSLVIHNPLVLVVVAYVVAVFVHDFGLAGVTALQVVTLAVGYWTAVAASETSRKVGPPESERDCQTYSRALGWRVAAWVPAFFLALSAGCLLSVAIWAGAGWWVKLLLGAAAGLGLGSCLRFRLAPSDRSARLQPFTALYALVANVGLPLALVQRYGLVWV